MTIQQFPRDAEQKRQLAEKVTQSFVEIYGASPESVQIFFQETDRQDWAKGGKLGGNVPSAD
ncbi:tautomerase family protein [Salinicola avicenniae]|uniref:tautomerase family protein n=1 Tax=Salinicola avicenniae TaxID=2916836 RepID=UPI00299F87F9|nr:tautomerase family protein [Salinicola sp. S1-1-8]